MKSLLVLTMFSAGLAQAAWSDYEEARELRIDAAGLSEIGIDAGAGRLVVTAVDGAEVVLVLATIVIPDADDDEAREIMNSSMRLGVEIDGSRATLTSHFADGFRMFGDSPRIDLEVRVPRSLAVRIDDGSGSIRASGTGAPLTIDDGSGSIVLDDIGGPVRIDDGSGSIEISGVRGDLSIVDGSGSIRVRDVQGTVTVDDGSGSIDISDVQRDLVILDDGSGSLAFSGIGGKVDDRR